LDITLEANNTFEHTPKKGYKVFAYLIEGNGHFNDELIGPYHCVLFDNGAVVTIKSQDKLRFLLISGSPLNEPIAWGGPIVMNTREELELAFQELDEGTFIKRGNSVKAARGFYQDLNLFSPHVEALSL
jgi:hypothetical protein